MRGLFVRVYAALVLVLLASVAAVALIAPPPDTVSLDHQVHAMAGLWPDDVAARLADPSSSTDTVLAALSAQLGSPVVLLPVEAVVGSLGGGARRALAEGEPVVQLRGAGPAIYVPVDHAMVVELRPGPAPARLLDGPRGIALAALVLLGLSGAVYLMVRPLEDQLSAISATAQRLGGGELGARVDIARQDGAGQLAASFNGMADRVQTMVEGRKTLLHGVSHELRTPLARLRFALELVEMAPTQEDRAKRLREAAGDIDELEGLVRELLQFSRLEGVAAEGDREPTVVEPLLALIADDAQRLRAEVAVSFTVEGTLGELSLDRTLFQRAIGNLVNNAVRYADGAVRISAVREAGRFSVLVEDDGPGVPEAQRESIFDPFVRLDAARSRDTGGTGLGLAIASGCARAHRGSITVETSLLGGALFRWTMPLGY